MGHLSCQDQRLKIWLPFIRAPRQNFACQL
jgi:hypothetical protein